MLVIEISYSNRILYPLLSLPGLLVYMALNNAIYPCAAFYQTKTRFSFGNCTNAIANEYLNAVSVSGKGGCL